MLLDADNTISLESPVFSVKEADNYMEQLWSTKWPRFAAFVNARYNAKIYQIEAAILFLY